MGKKNKKKILKRKNLVLQKENDLLKESILQAEHTVETKSAYLSHMSHDIRTSINGIIGMTGIAIKNFEDQDRILDCLKKIDSSSQYLISLVNDILDLSRIESGKMSANHEPLDIRKVIDRCAAITEGLLTEKNVKLIKEFAAFKHPMLIGDELHLCQILINILGNAVKFTPNGGRIYFQVTECSDKSGKSLCHFEIEDTGIGMEPSFLPKIWEPFIQGNGRSHKESNGTGLGMAITKKLVDLMGGKITVESKLGIGSKFTVEIAFDIDRHTQEAKTERKSNVSLNGMKILLAEDNELNMEIAKTILEDQGIDVTTAENGQLAVNIFNNLSEHMFDAILMDVRMPIMDGLSAAKAIRKLTRKDAATVPIIAMTADAYDEDIERTAAAGMNAHLTKPVQPELLFQVLRNFYSRRH